MGPLRLLWSHTLWSDMHEALLCATARARSHHAIEEQTSHESSLLRRRQRAVSVASLHYTATSSASSPVQRTAGRALRLEQAALRLLFNEQLAALCASPSRRGLKRGPAVVYQRQQQRAHAVQSRRTITPRGSSSMPPHRRGAGERCASGESEKDPIEATDGIRPAEGGARSGATRGSRVK